MEQPLVPLQRPSIELHRTAGSKDRPPEYTWTIKLYGDPDASAAEHDDMISEIARCNAKLRELFPTDDQIKALEEAYALGQKVGLLAERQETIDAKA